VLYNYTCVRRKKIKKIYTGGAPHHATSALGVCQMGSEVFSKESSNFKDIILTKIFTRKKLELVQIRGGKNILTQMQNNLSID